MSDFWLACDDCMDLMPKMQPFFDCIVTDPPYGQTSLSWDKPVQGWPELAKHLLKPSGSMWVFGSLRHFTKFACEFEQWKLSHDVIWEKHNGAGFFNDRFRTVHEIAAHFYPKTVSWKDVFKNPQFTNDATKRTVRRKKTPAHWVGARNESHYVSEDGGPRLQRSVFFERSLHGYAEHPTQKPDAILAPLLKYSCPENGIVFDPFMGSGSTGVVARQLGMQFIGIEKNPEYFAIAERRIREAT
jgi:site-specific DNA-methyltransferase (adenine-specific)